jgi:hypothetical protein
MTNDQADFLRALDAASPLTQADFERLWRAWRGRVNLEPLALIADANGWALPTDAR